MLTTPVVYHAGPNAPYMDRPARKRAARHLITRAHDRTVPVPVTPWNRKEN